MKKFIPMLFVVMILATGCPQPEPEVHQVEIGLFTPYWSFPETLNGKVKEVIEKNYFGIEQEGKIVKGDRLTVKARDTINWTNDFKLVYDENGNLVESVMLDENDNVIQKNIQTLEEGRIVKSESERNDTLRSYALLTYNEAGQLVKLEQFRLPADTLMWSVKLLSDDQGNFTEWHWMDWKGADNGKNLFTVSQEGQRTGFKFYNREGELWQEEKFTFNEMGFLVKQEIITDEGEESTTTYEYEYEYDEMDNWIKVVSSTDDQLIVAERTISYFD